MKSTNRSRRQGLRPIDRPLVWVPADGSVPDPHLIGEKAAGLASLSRDVAVPEFVVLTVEWISRGVAKKNSIRDVVSDEEWRNVEDTIQSLLKRSPLGVYLRPSVPGEALSDRGSTVSLRSDADMESVIDGIRDLYRLNGSSPAIAVLIQSFVAGQLGHLSNEFRLTRDPARWLVEHQLSSFDSPQARRTTHFRLDASEGQESATTSSSVARFRGALEAVAKSVWNSRSRWHFEWVFDGETLWIVQADRELPPPSTDLPGEVWMQRTMAPLPEPVWPMRRAIPGEDQDYPKLRWQARFAEVGGQTTDFIVLDDATTWTSLFAGTVPEALRAGIAALLEGGPIVARTDVVSIDIRKGLPRSDCLLTPTQATDFLLGKVAGSSVLRSASKRILIFHRFIPARASAFAYARPNERVQVDATWGVPDGLSVFPHDTYFVSANGGLDRFPRYKAVYLDPTADGSWQPQRAHPDIGWAPALSDDQVRRMAGLTRLISQQESRPILVMFFASGPPDVMRDGILPWILDYEVPPESRYAETSRGLFGVPVVRDAAELTRIIQTGHAPSRVLYRPPSTGDAIRDEAPHRAIGAVAKEAGISLLWEGSVLAHVWYVLARTGATILPLAVEDPPDDGPATQEFNKLVRDGIPAKIERGGERAVTVNVAGDTLLRLLRQKLVEESLEVAGTHNRHELIEELADVREVIDALMLEAQIDPEEISRVQQKKRESRGGFQAGVVLRQTSVPNDSDALPLADSPSSSLSEHQIWDLTDPRPEIADGDTIVVPRVPSDRVFDPDRSIRTLSIKGLVFEIIEDGKSIRFRLLGRQRQSRTNGQLDFLGDPARDR